MLPVQKADASKTKLQPEYQSGLSAIHQNCSAELKNIIRMNPVFSLQSWLSLRNPSAMLRVYVFICLSVCAGLD